MSENIKIETFDCKVLTPMFLYGTSGVELRSPSIKGVLRYWWRAFNPELFNNNNTEYLMREQELFGGTKSFSDPNNNGNTLNGKKSPFNLDCFLTDKIKGETRYLRPNKKNSREGLEMGAICEGEEFQLKFSYVYSSKWKVEGIGSLLKLVSLLGGFGKRSRRGFGRFRITEEAKESGSNEKVSLEVDNLNLIELINSISEQGNPGFEPFSEEPTQGIRRDSNGFNAGYPWVKKIYWPSNVSDKNNPNEPNEIVNKITTFCSEKARDSNKKKCLGIHNPRFASPLIFSIGGRGNGTGYYPILIEMNRPDDNNSELCNGLITEFFTSFS